MQKIKQNNFILIISLILFLNSFLFAQEPNQKQKIEINPQEIEKIPAYKLSLKQLIQEAQKNIKKAEEKIKQQKFLEKNKAKELLVCQHFERGNLLYRQGKYEEAKKEWFEAIKITEDPAMKEYIKNLERITQEEEAIKKRQLQEVKTEELAQKKEEISRQIQKRYIKRLSLRQRKVLEKEKQARLEKKKRKIEEEKKKQELALKKQEEELKQKELLAKKEQAQKKGEQEQKKKEEALKLAKQKKEEERLRKEEELRLAKKAKEEEILRKKLEKEKLEKERQIKAQAEKERLAKKPVPLVREQAPQEIKAVKKKPEPKPKKEIPPEVLFPRQESPIVKYLCELGLKAYKEKRFNDALDYFRKALLIEPNNQTAKTYIDLIFQQNPISP